MHSIHGLTFPVLSHSDSCCCGWLWSQFCRTRQW